MDFPTTAFCSPLKHVFNHPVVVGQEMLERKRVKRQINLVHGWIINAH